MSGQWSDLKARVLSAIVMLAVGLFALIQGGFVFHVLVAAICAGMIWELTRMMAQDAPRFSLQMGALAGAAVFAVVFVPKMLVLPILIAPAIVGATSLKKDRLIYGAYAAALMLASAGFLMLRATKGMDWVLWLVAIVVVTDVAGYFAGRIIGGPKFWPSISPKKTWSGTGAGWICAALVGLALGGPFLALISAVMSFASQLGDIAESAIKRRCGIKDSSQLIPGHGGLLDRFDGLMAAALVVAVVSALVGLPPRLG